MENARRAKILVVDDEEVVRAVLELFFLRKGWAKDEIFFVSDASSGWEIIKKEIPSIVFCDFNIPRISGGQFCREVKKEFPDIKFFLMSGDYFEEESKKAGSDGFFMKPFTFEILKAAIK